MIKVKEVDIDSFSKPRVDIKYPYIELLEFNDTLPAIVGILKQGDMQIKATYKGVTKVICSINQSAYNIDKLLRTQQKVRIWLSPDKYKDIKTVLDYLEVI